jgi:hypothetical protein
MDKIRDYKLEIGNSNSGEIGLVAYTAARNIRQAAINFRENLGGTDDGHTIEIKTGIYYANVYLGEDAFNVRNIRRV